MIKLRCEAIIQKERCILEQQHKGNHKKNWITQKELNKRLESCGYGGSLYPANWWSEKELLRVESICYAIKMLEDKIERKVSFNEFYSLVFTDGKKIIIQKQT